MEFGDGGKHHILPSDTVSEEVKLEEGLACTRYCAEG